LIDEKNRESVTEDEISERLNSTEPVFGKQLRRIRQAKKISIRQLARAVAKTPTYLSDIENGNNRPPEKELLERIIKELNIENSPALKNTLFDLAAKERKDVPADVKEYIMSNKNLLQIIRTARDTRDDEVLWSRVSKIVHNKGKDKG